MVVFAEFIYFNLTNNEATGTIENTHRKHNDKYGFNDNYNVSVICRTEYDLEKKSKKIIWTDYYLIQSGKKQITSNGRYKTNEVNKLFVKIEGEINNFVIITYLKMKIPLFWRKMFMHIANNRDYIYNFCNNLMINFNDIVLNGFYKIKGKRMRVDMFVFLYNKWR